MSGKSFLERSSYYLAYEYPTKIRLAVATLSPEVIWRRPGPESNSIGNLLLHLAGNIRQWVVCGIGGAPDERHRSDEFAATSGPGADELLALLELAIRDADAVLSTLSESDLTRRVNIQGRDTSILGAIYHVVEHFSTHTGQILLLVKMYAPGQVRFYEDAGGLAIPLWGGKEGSTSR